MPKFCMHNLSVPSWIEEEWYGRNTQILMTKAQKKHKTQTNLEVGLETIPFPQEVIGLACTVTS